MYTDRLAKVHEQQWTKLLPVKTGQLLEIHESIGEWDAKRTWKFKALVLQVKKPNSPDGTFTVRGVSSRIVVEKIYPISYTNFAKLILVDEYKVRRSKIFYIRDKVGKDARMKSIISSHDRNKNLLDSIVATPAAETTKQEEKVETKQEEK